MPALAAARGCPRFAIFDPQPAPIVPLRTHDAGAQYEAWRDVPGGRYPFRVVLSFPETGLRAELELDSVELNPQLETSLFRVDREATP